MRIMIVILSFYLSGCAGGDTEIDSRSLMCVGFCTQQSLSKTFDQEEPVIKEQK